MRLGNRTVRQVGYLANNIQFYEPLGNLRIRHELTTYPKPFNTVQIPLEHKTNEKNNLANRDHRSGVFEKTLSKF